MALLCVIVVFVLLFQVSGGGTIATETVAANEEWIQLSPGSPVRRELAAGGKDVFGINVAAGKVIQFSIEKGDLSLSTVLYGPSGTRVLEHLSQEFETVDVSFPADAPGVYRIELQSRETAPRRYELTLHPLRNIKPGDRKDSEACEAMAKADALRSSWTARLLGEASETYDQAASIWASLPDYSDAARAMLKSGDVHFLLGNYPKASERYERSATWAATAGDSVTQARALTQLGRVYSTRGDNSSAEKYIAKALYLLDDSRNGSTAIMRNATGATLSALGEVTYAKGNLPKAAEQFQRALELLDGDRNGQANVHMFLAYMAGASQPERAKSELEEASNLFAATNNKDGEALVQVALGLYYSNNRKKDEAIAYHRQAIETFQSIGDQLNQATALNAVGQAYESNLQFDIALGNYKAALQLFLEIDAVDFATMALLKVGTMHRRFKEFNGALDYFERCRALSHSAGKVRTEAAALNELAGLYADQGKFAAAARYYQQALKLYEGIRDFRGQALALNNYGDFLLSTGKPTEALHIYQRAFVFSDEVKDKELLTTTIYNFANAHRALGEYETALSFIKRSIGMIDAVRNDVGSPESRAAFVSGEWRHYELYEEILMQLDRQHPDQGFAIQAFLLNDKSRARLVLDLLNRVQADQHDGPAAELSNEEKRLRAYLTSLTNYEMDLSLNKKDPTELAEVNEKIVQLRSQYQEVQAKLSQHLPPPPSLDRFTPSNLAELQSQLRNSNTLLLDFHLGDQRSYLWAITDDSFHSYEMPPRQVIAEAASKLHKLAIAREEPDDATKKSPQPDLATSDRLLAEQATVLSNMLLEPVARELKDKKLLIIPEDELQYVPFEALPVPGKAGLQLIDTNEINRITSFSTLMAIRAEHKRVAAPDKIAVVIADPVFSKSDDRVQSEAPSGAVASAAPVQTSSKSVDYGNQMVLQDKVPARLPHAGEEADAIVAAAPRGTTLIAKGFDATYETATSATVGQYQIVHFATHGFFDNEHPEISSIVLTRVDRHGVEKNGVMPLHDIYNLNLSAELTVLSACQTALGKDVRGEGLVGLTHSFIAAGSKTVVASLWKVDDRATAALMAEFYRALLQDGMTTGEALRAAKLKMKQDKRWSAPYYWAGFVLQGEYTNRINIGRRSWFGPIVLLLSLVLISAGTIFYFQRRRRSVPAARV